MTLGQNVEDLVPYISTHADAGPLYLESLLCGDVILPSKRRPLKRVQQGEDQQTLVELSSAVEVIPKSGVRWEIRLLAVEYAEGDVRGAAAAGVRAGGCRGGGGGSEGSSDYHLEGLPAVGRW